MITLQVQPSNDIQQYLDVLSIYGGGVLELNPADIFYPTSDLNIPSNCTIDGNGATIDFGGQAFGVRAIGSEAYSTGTLAVNYGSTTLVGTGTTWTSNMVGQSILIGDYWYEIATFIDTTHLTLTSNYIGLNITGATYVIATTIDNIKIQNITLYNSSTTLFNFQYVNGLTIDGMSADTATQAINAADSANISYLNSDTSNCTIGIKFNNTPFCTFNNYNLETITGGTGLELIKVNNAALGISAFQDITGVGLKITNCSNLGFVNFSIIKCSSHGIELVSGNSDTDISGGYVNSCGGDGIKLTATSDRIEITDNSFLNNTGYGINIANANCDNNILVGNNTSGNGGTLNDSGTGTLKSALVNNFI
jgi:Right handed beta helix region